MKTALQVAHWMRQMVSPPRRTRASCEWRVRRVARQAPTRAAAGLVEELKAEGEEEGEDELDKRFGLPTRA